VGCDAMLRCGRIPTFQMVAAWTSVMLVSYHKIKRRHNTEEIYLNLHRRENFKSRLKLALDHLANNILRVYITFVCPLENCV
jgi:hypothetical protein